MWSLTTSSLPSALNSAQHLAIKWFLKQQILLAIGQLGSFFTIPKRVFTLEKAGHHWPRSLEAVPGTS